MAADVSAKLFAQDELARPIPETPTVSDLAKGLDRTLVLGGGGEYYVAWYCGFFHGLYELGVDLNIAEMVVGTSAGAYAGSSLTSRHFQRLRSEFDFFGHFPSLFARLAPVASPNLSQRRAKEINISVKDSLGYTASHTYTMTINVLPTLGALSPTQGYVSAWGFPGTIPISGGTGPFSVTAQANLPPGLTATTTGTNITFTGIPTTALT